MRHLSKLAVFCIASVAVAQSFDTPKPLVPLTSILHNQWKLTPVGTHQKTRDMLLGSALSPDGKQIALTSGGYNAHQLYIIDVSTGLINQTIDLKDTWNGIVWANDGNRLYVCGGGQPKIHVFERNSGQPFTAKDPISLSDALSKTENKQREAQCYLSGMALSKDDKHLYFANLATDSVYKLDLSTNAIVATIKLDFNAHPYCLKLTPDGKTLLATQGALGSLAIIDTATFVVTKQFMTDSHPNDIAIATDGRIFVSCANSDTVVVIDPDSGMMSERIRVRLTPKSPAGAIPNSLSITPDNKTLFVANAGNNCLTVVDISDVGESKVSGFVPTGWYPTWVYSNGQSLLIGSGKGMGTGPNSIKQYPSETRGKDDPYYYIARQLYGIVSKVQFPNPKQLELLTKQTLRNTPYNDAVNTYPVSAPRRGQNPIPSRLGDTSPIKHVLYIIKENRTYDQVLGDLEKGNGDKDICMFGEKVTPNLHKIAREFVTLDNTYCSGEVSGNGHPWSTGAYSTDIGERAWMMSYGDHADWPLTDRDIVPPVGRIWDVVDRAGLSFLSYYFTWTTPNTRHNMPASWAQGFDRRRDFQNADVYIADLKRWEQTGKMPRFAIMSLREDHTDGTTPGRFTPKACVASNDLAVGKIIDALSHSRFWKETAVFIIQDDAQDGPDHVDAHRTTAFVVSPYTKTGLVDSTHYTTCSMLRTMELILGVAPMSQYDAAANPMYNAFAKRPNLEPYDVVPATTDLFAVNKKSAVGATESARMNFDRPDDLTDADVYKLNRILWHSVMGKTKPYPAIVRGHISE
jgi:YVTN family beta-propeller protein